MAKGERAMAGGRKLTKLALLGVVAIALGACTERFRNHGYVPPEEDLANIVVGVDTRESVAATVGPPSTGSLIDASGYYYVKSRVRHYAYQKPEVVEREVVAITFDSAGVVQNIERFGLERGRMVPLSRRVTRVESSDNNFLRRLLGAIGRFAPGNIGN